MCRFTRSSAEPAEGAWRRLEASKVGNNNDNNYCFIERVIVAGKANNVSSSTTGFRGKIVFVKETKYKKKYSNFAGREGQCFECVAVSAVVV